MADETKAPQAPQPARAAKCWQLANGKVLVDVPTIYGKQRITNERLKDDKVVAFLQQNAPSVFRDGLVVLA
jgi:hypothetical protein